MKVNCEFDDPQRQLVAIYHRILDRFDEGAGEDSEDIQTLRAAANDIKKCLQENQVG